MSDPHGRFVVRPDSRRYLRSVLGGAGPLLLIGLGTISFRLARELGWLAVPAVAALTGPPALLFGAYALRRTRTVSLTATGADLTLTDWLGRRQTLRRPGTAVYCTIYSGGGRMEHIVITGPADQQPLVLRTRQWRPADLAQLWLHLGVVETVDDLTSVPGVRSRFPGAPLPYATRYPITVGLLCALATFGYIALVMSLFPIG